MAAVADVLVAAGVLVKSKIKTGLVLIAILAFDVLK